MKPYWYPLNTWMAQEFPDLLASLNPGIPAEQWNPLENELGITLPDSFKAFYEHYNGQEKADPTGFFFGLHFLPYEQVQRQWQVWRDIIEMEGEEGMASMSENSVSLVPGKIKPLYANLRWIPFIHDWGGNHVGLDFDPDEDGVVGQVINFGRDEERKFVLADSFEGFIGWMGEQLQQGNYIIDRETGSRKMDFGLKSHPDTHFIDAARDIFGKA